MEGLHLLVSTIMLRPYVFIFLAAFLAMAVPAWGWWRTLIYTVLAYTLAWAAEFSSTHIGFPFGLYSYIQEPTADKELWVAGVPFMDSLSFVFLTFSGLQMARLVFEPLLQGPLGRWDIRWGSLERPIRVGIWALAGLFTMGLDLIIDPVALRGERWFLGQIYRYAHHGSYFGVPVSNFLGWAILAWVIVGVFGLLDRYLLPRYLGEWRNYPADAILCVGLYAGILVFNLTVTFAIGEIVLGFVGCVLSAVLFLPVLDHVYGSSKVPPG